MKNYLATGVPRRCHRSPISSIARPSVSSCVLVLLLTGLLSVTLAKPAKRGTNQSLLISSNIEPGKFYDQERVGPFVIGQNLIITCSTKDSTAFSLSWWEGGEQIPSLASADEGVVSRSLIVGTLHMKDSLRHLTCRELTSGAEKSVDLDVVDDHMEIQKDGGSLRDEETLHLLVGKGVKLECFVNGSDPSTGTWWEGNTKLPAKRTVLSPNAITNQLELLPASIEDNGRELTCRARNGQLTKTVVLAVLEEKREDALLSPTATTKTEMTIIPSMPETATGKISYVAHDAVSEKDNGTNVISHVDVSEEKKVIASSATIPITEGKSDIVKPSIPTGQNRPASDTEEIQVSLVMYLLIIGGVAIGFIGLVVGIVIFVITKLCKRISYLDTTSTAQRQGANPCEHQTLADTSVENQSVENTLERMDPNDLPPEAALLPRRRAVEEEVEETASSGGRLSAVMPDDRDHSYYYPDLTNNSYYYPKITDEVKETILLGNSA